MPSTQQSNTHKNSLHTKQQKQKPRRAGKVGGGDDDDEDFEITAMDFVDEDEDVGTYNPRRSQLGGIWGKGPGRGSIRQRNATTTTTAAVAKRSAGLFYIHLHLLTTHPLIPNKYNTTDQ